MTLFMSILHLAPKTIKELFAKIYDWNDKEICVNTKLNPNILNYTDWI